ncbi:MAG: phage holin family protein [Oscillospiraceae bacterium]|nr:phage holin family protein [Oscillospiraceae bacterium]
MDKTINNIKAALAALMGLLTGLWGWLGWLVMGWICCMALDYLTGSLAAAKEGDWSSGKAREGIWHKGGMIVVVLVAAGADLLISLVLTNLPVLDLPIQYPGLVCPVVLVWYIVTELGSMAENAATMGAPVPAWLVKLLAMSKNAVDSAGDKLGGEDGGNA